MRRFVARKAAVSTTAMNSATTMDIQMPSMSQMVGKSSTAASLYTRRAQNEVAAEVSPVR